jgi:hypothetical protein
LVDTSTISSKTLGSLSAIPETAQVAELLGRSQKLSGSKKADAIEKLVASIKPLKPNIRERMLDLLSIDSKQAKRSGDRRVVLNWEEIREMQRNGVDFGGHGLSHEILTEISTEGAEAEIAECKKTLEEKLRPEVLMFAYPNGNQNEAIREFVKGQGFRCAVATQPGLADSRSDLFALPRLNIHDGCCTGPLGNFSKALFACHIEGIFG